MCKALGISRSAYYAWVHRQDHEGPRACANRELTKQIKAIHEASRETYGAPRIHAELKTQGETCSLNRVARLMREARIRSKVGRKFRVSTTDSRHSHPVAENLLPETEFNRPNQVWVADITYIPTDEGWLYLASIMDLFSRLIVGWSLKSTLRTELVEDALRMALGRRPVPELHHSDRGSQYASKVYRDLMTENGITCSMSGKGNCYDNAAKESFFHTLKVELVHHERYQTRAEARASVFEYIEVFYNRQRRHSALGYLTPTEFEAACEKGQIAAA